MEPLVVVCALLVVAVIGLAIRAGSLSRKLADAQSDRDFFQEGSEKRFWECDRLTWTVADLAYEGLQLQGKVEARDGFVADLRRELEAVKRECQDHTRAVAIQDEELKIVRAELQQEIQSKAELVEKMNRLEEQLPVPASEPAKPKTKRKKKAT